METFFANMRRVFQGRQLDLLTDAQRIAPRDYQMRRLDARARPLLLDVRPANEFEICHLSEALSAFLCDQNEQTFALLLFSDCPLKDIESSIVSDLLAKIPRDDTGKRLRLLIYNILLAYFAVFVICHRGNNSQLAVNALQARFGRNDDLSVRFRDIVGGIDAWSREIDASFPQY